MENTPRVQPIFRELTEGEANDLLDRNHVGRIAYTFRDTVDIRPIHYVRSGSWLFGRTSAGDKLTTLGHHQWVAFEVDEISGPMEWKSVIARGTFRPLKYEGSSHDLDLYERAFEAVRALYPDAFTNNDQLAFRTEIFGIHVDSVSGRSCST
jgi:nitroimidazol reductase NimA-like FMN-containing flavoprotein (pyridoxamine 5'-phosphate oxidase superfamily)